jgi:N6-adenosine-specific RNA methylase IME4
MKARLVHRRIDDIVIGTRHRKDIGDIEGLLDSIQSEGLLHPIVINADEPPVLIAGERRLRACKLLGWKEIPATIVPLTDIVRGELAENAHRKDFLPSEIEAIRRALEPIEKAAAKERQSRKISGTGEETRDRIGAFAGVSGRTVEKIRDIVEAAEAEPEKFGKLVEDMDRTGRVNGPHKRLKVIKQAEVIRKEPPPLPNKGPYRVIVTDPPWLYEKRDEDPSNRGVLSYLTMSIAQICALDVTSLAHKDSILWLWTTNAHMREAFDVLDAWGFQQKTILTWTKDKMGRGDWLRGQTEHCLMATRGNPIVHLTNQTTVLSAPARAHSQKPDEFYELVEKLCPAPRYAYLFSRSTRERWDCHGDEVPVDSEGVAYDATDDLTGSINVAYEAVRERVADGGPTWTPPPSLDASNKIPIDDGIPDFLRRKRPGAPE